MKQLEEYRDNINKNLMRELITALRSGDYKQTSGNLHAGEAYCCLGVATELCGAEWLQRNGDDVHFPFFTMTDPDDRGEFPNIRSPFYMPFEVREKFGLPNGESDFVDNFHVIVSDDDHVFEIPAGYTTEDRVLLASCLNDEGESFDVIANALERTYLDDDYYNAWLARTPAV